MLSVDIERPREILVNLENAHVSAGAVAAAVAVEVAYVLCGHGSTEMYDALLPLLAAQAR